MKETSRRVVWTGELPDHVVDLQADDFHDKGTGLQDTRLRKRDKHEDKRTNTNYLSVSCR